MLFIYFIAYCSKVVLGFGAISVLFFFYIQM